MGWTRRGIKCFNKLLSMGTPGLSANRIWKARLKPNLDHVDNSEDQARDSNPSCRHSARAGQGSGNKGTGNPLHTSIHLSVQTYVLVVCKPLTWHRLSKMFGHERK
jgi:hypothetical protein